MIFQKKRKKIVIFRPFDRTEICVPTCVCVCVFRQQFILTNSSLLFLPHSWQFRHTWNINMNCIEFQLKKMMKTKYNNFVNVMFMFISSFIVWRCTLAQQGYVFALDCVFLGAKPNRINQICIYFYLKCVNSYRIWSVNISIARARDKNKPFHWRWKFILIKHRLFGVMCGAVQCDAMHRTVRIRGVADECVIVIIVVYLSRRRTVESIELNKISRSMFEQQAIFFFIIILPSFSFIPLFVPRLHTDVTFCCRSACISFYYFCSGLLAVCGVCLPKQTRKILLIFSTFDWLDDTPAEKMKRTRMRAQAHTHTFKSWLTSAFTSNF